MIEPALTRQTKTSVASETRRRRAALGTALATLVLTGLAVAGCSHPDRAVATSAIPSDFHARHPVALENARTVLDIFPVGPGARLDARQQRDIEAFAADYLAHGQSRIRVLVPRGGVDAGAVDATLTAARRTLAAAGVKGAIEVGSYAVADPHLASALRMSFVKLQAGGAHRCGDWPDDLGPGPNVDDWENKGWYNLGCANQATLAAQVADPRDLVHPRAEEPADVDMRTRAIKDLRGDSSAALPAGQDPSTTWTQSQLVPIGGH